jgi:hypothetical protein
MPNSPETKAIRQRMEEVRCDLDSGFQGIVEDARDIGDWTYYVRTYPWAVLGVSLVAGYLLAPRLGFGVQPEMKVPDGSSAPNASHEPPPLQSKSAASGKVLSFVGNLVMRGLTAYAVQHADRFFATTTSKSDQKDHR